MKSFKSFVNEAALKPGESAPGVQGVWPTKGSVNPASSKYDVKKTKKGVQYTRKSSSFENPSRYSKNDRANSYSLTHHRADRIRSKLAIGEQSDDILDVASTSKK